MDDYIRKPVTQSALCDILERWLPPVEAVVQQETVAEPALGGGKVLSPVMLQNLRDITENDPAMLSEIITVYLKKTPPRMEAIRDAVDRGDAQALERTAHTLKASSAQMGVVSLARLCEELESLGRSGTTAGASEFVAQLASAYQQVKMALESEASRASFQGHQIK
jgi:HPt (histidine-containing phosphotransfer) domain-containing protein